MDEILRKVKTVPQHVPNASSVTQRATSVLCEVDGGAFLLLLEDLRPIAPYVALADYSDRFEEGKSAFVEVGRYVLSPVAFAGLKKSIALAEAWYVAHFGELPDVDAFVKKLAAELPDKPQEVERRLGFRQSGE